MLKGTCSVAFVEVTSERTAWGRQLLTARYAYISVAFYGLPGEPWSVWRLGETAPEQVGLIGLIGLIVDVLEQHTCRNDFHTHPQFLLPPFNSLICFFDVWPWMHPWHLPNNNYHCYLHLASRLLNLGE